MNGRLIAVTGPSGVGKDSVIAALAARDPSLYVTRRTITRPEEAGGEPFRGVSSEDFARMVGDGAFCLHWQAHGLSYGIPVTTLTEVCAGATCVANLSRGRLAAAARIFPAMLVLSITAAPGIVADRLAGRGRETAEDIARRIARTAPPPPPDVPVVQIANDGPIEDAAQAALAAIRGHQP